MRLALAGLCLISSVTMALAQTPAAPAEKTPESLKQSDGRTKTPEDKGVLQPQGWTGPINTGSSGAPAESPQGQTPPGMQSAPEGSNKATVEPAK